MQRTASRQVALGSEREELRLSTRRPERRQKETEAARQKRARGMSGEATGAQECTLAHSAACVTYTRGILLLNLCHKRAVVRIQRPVGRAAGRG
jgi:hypothetical protein